MPHRKAELTLEDFTLQTKFPLRKDEVKIPERFQDNVPPFKIQDLTLVAVTFLITICPQIAVVAAVG